MSDRIRQLLTTTIVAIVAGSLAGVTSAALAQDSEPSGTVQVAGPNADTVDSRHAVNATTNKSWRARKLVATNDHGYLPNNIVKPKWSLISGMPAGFADGVDHRGVTKVTLTMLEGGTVDVPPGLRRFAYATCPSGTVVTGGGFSQIGTRLRVLHSLPVGTSQWQVAGINMGNVTEPLTAWAMCMRVQK